MVSDNYLWAVMQLDDPALPAESQAKITFDHQITGRDSFSFTVSSEASYTLPSHSEPELRVVIDQDFAKVKELDGSTRPQCLDVNFRAVDRDGHDHPELAAVITDFMTNQPQSEQERQMKITLTSLADDAAQQPEFQKQFGEITLSESVEEELEISADFTVNEDLDEAQTASQTR